MPSTEEKLRVLAKVARAFQGLTWAVGSSAMLYLRGITEDFHDLDLFVTMEDAGRAKEILKTLGTFYPSETNPRYCSRCFAEFTVDGVDIDLIGGFAIRAGERVHDCSLRQELILGSCELYSQRIPLMDPEIWISWYTLMGRPEWTEKIRKFLENK